MQEPFVAAVRAVGVDKPFARNAAHVAAVDGSGPTPWTLPLHRSEAVGTIGIVRTAAIIVLAATSGMRSSELMELRVGCRRPIEEPLPDLKRFRIASKIVKGQPLGGTDDEWVVIEPAYRAIGLAEQLHDNAREGALLFGRFAFDVRSPQRHPWRSRAVNAPLASELSPSRQRTSPHLFGPLVLVRTLRTIGATRSWMRC